MPNVSGIVHPLLGSGNKGLRDAGDFTGFARDHHEIAAFVERKKAWLPNGWRSIPRISTGKPYGSLRKTLIAGWPASTAMSIKPSA